MLSCTLVSSLVVLLSSRRPCCSQSVECVFCVYRIILCKCQQKNFITKWSTFVSHHLVGISSYQPYCSSAIFVQMHDLPILTKTTTKGHPISAPLQVCTSSSVIGAGVRCRVVDILRCGALPRCSCSS